MFSEDQLLEALQQFDKQLKLADFGWSLLRSIGFAIIKGMAGLVDGLGSVLYETTNFLGFYSNHNIGGGSTTASGILNGSESGSILESLVPYQKFGIGLAILMIAALFFFGKNDQNREVPKNILYLIIVMGLLPTLMSDGVSIVQSTVTNLNDSQGELGFATIKSNLSDMYTFVDDGWSDPNLQPGNQLSDLSGFDINEKVSDPAEDDPTGVLNHVLFIKPNSDEKEVVELPEKSDSWITADLENMFLMRYYRWHVDWLSCIISLTCLLFALVLSCIRAGRLGMEVTINYLFANIVGFFSFSDNRRLKQSVMSIVVGFVTLITLLYTYYIFLYYMDFLPTVTSNKWAQLFGIVGGCWLLYDGPAIVQQLLGVDAGLGSAGALFAGIGLGVGGKALRGAVSTASGGLATAGGFLAGNIAAHREEKNEGESSKNKLTNEDRGDKNENTNLDQIESEKALDNSSTNDSGREVQKNVPIAEQLKNDSSSTSEEKKKNTGSRVEGLDNPVANQGSSGETAAVDELEKNNSSNSIEGVDNSSVNAADYSKEAVNEFHASTTTSESPTKPKNPIASHLSEKLQTSKNYDSKGSIVRDTYSKGKTSYDLGKEYAQYKKDKAEFKAAKQQEKNKK